MDEVEFCVRVSRLVVASYKNGDVVSSALLGKDLMEGIGSIATFISHAGVDLDGCSERCIHLEDGASIGSELLKWVEQKLKERGIE